MNKLYTLLVFVITLTISAQAPQGFNYQATVRNNTGALMINKNVTFKFNIIKDIPTSGPVYSETHNAPTDDLGAVNLVVGKGTVTTGTFAGIDWGAGSYYLNIELNTGNGFVAMGTSQLLSVPYALYAKSSGNAITPGTANGQILYWNGTAWVTLAPGSDGNILRWTNGVPTWENTVPNLNITEHLFNFDSNNQLTLYLKTKLVDDGGENITEQGIYYSPTNPFPTENDTKVVYTGNMGSNFFTAYVSNTFTQYENYLVNLTENLNVGTRYYIRAYAVNSKGKGYSKVLTVTTPTSLPIPAPTIQNFEYIKSAIADVYSTFDLSQKSFSPNLRIGFVWNTSPNPTILNNKIEESFNSSNYTNKRLKGVLTNLTLNTRYYVKAFASDGVTTIYSPEASFSTLPLRVPSLTTDLVSQITSNSARLDGNIALDGGSAITNYGFVWSTSQSPTILSNNGINSIQYNNQSNFPPSWEIVSLNYSSNINGLSPSTTYYVKAFATNSVGTAYGQEITFTTP